MREVEVDLVTLLEAETTHLELPRPGDPAAIATFDWAAQTRKVESVPARFEKAPEVLDSHILSGPCVCVRGWGPRLFV